MSILLESFGITVAFLIIGLVFFVIFARVLSGASEREDQYQRLSRLHHTTAQQRSREKQKLLWQIGKPECSNGTYSQRQNALWADYKMLDAYDKALTEQAHNQLVELRGYLPDEIADIIEGRR